MADGLAIVFVLFAATIVGRGRGARVFGAGLGRLLGRCGPSGELPDDAGEGLEGESAACPSAAGLARSIESAKAGVYSTLIRLGAELVASAGLVRRVGVIDGPVFPVIVVSIGVDCRQGVGRLLTVWASSWGRASRVAWGCRHLYRWRWEQIA